MRHMDCKKNYSNGLGRGIYVMEVFLMGTYKVLTWAAMEPELYIRRPLGSVVRILKLTEPCRAASHDGSTWG